MAESFFAGVISDTHGLLRKEALRALAGSRLIIHAGDVGDRPVITALESIAPVIAVRGNIDKTGWVATLPETAVVDLNGLSVYVLHDLKELDLDPAAAGFRAVISGHTHKPLIEERNGVLFLNPGSAGPRRFKLPICVARLHVQDGRLN